MFVLSFVDNVKIYKEKIGVSSYSILERVALKFDEYNVDLTQLTLEGYVDIVIEVQSNLLVSHRTMKEYLSTIKKIYTSSNVKLLDWVSTLTVDVLARAVANQTPKLQLFKDIQSVLKTIDIAEPTNYADEIKTICILAWNGFDVHDIVNVKLSDFNADEGYVVDKRLEKHFLSDVEIKTILQYRENKSYDIGSRTIYYINSPYLLRPVRQGQLKLTDFTLKNRVKRVVEKMVKRNIEPTINIRPLIANGAFYRAYTGHLSKFMFDITRMAQYERYVKEFWAD